MGIVNKMAAARSLQGLKHVKPIFSTTPKDARLRVLNLYKAWYRSIPIMCQDFDIPYSEDDCRAKLREIIEKNKNEKDTRVIDMLCVKGMQELDEVRHVWKQNCHVANYWKPTYNEQPDSFIGRFLDGHQPTPK